MADIPFSSSSLNISAVPADKITVFAAEAHYHLLSAAVIVLNKLKEEIKTVWHEFGRQMESSLNKALDIGK